MIERFSTDFITVIATTESEPDAARALAKIPDSACLAHCQLPT